MNVTVTPGALRGTVERVMTSKSQAHRLLICAGQAGEETRLAGLPPCEDAEATIRCLRALGAEIREENGELVIRRDGQASAMPEGHGTAKGQSVAEGEEKGCSGAGSGEESQTERAMMDCGESGSTLRFMLPVTAVRGVPAAFTGRGKLAERPLSPLYEEMTRHGAVLSPQGRFPLTVDGRLKAGEYLLAGNVSSQFISGLMMALPQAEEDSRIVIGGRLESRPYVELTAETLKMFGIRTETEETASRTPKNATAEQDRSGEPFRQEETVIRIPGRQLFRSPGRMTVEGDWSGAAFWLAAGALSEAGVTCAHVNPGSAQGDRAIAALLRRFGADVTETADSVTVRRGELLGCGIDAADIPDLVPILGVAAAYARGETRIRNIRRLRMKESDRVASVLAMIRSLGGQGEASENEMIIYGSEGLRGGTVDAFRDHRIAMAAAIAATGAEKPVTILGAEAVNKSYPGFFEEFERLGGGVRR